MAVRVLIVDDHPSFRTLARAVLVADGFDVVGEAGDGAAAISAVRELRPDVVLLDVQLPGADGFDVARNLAGARTEPLDDAGGGPPPVPAVVLVSSRSCSDYGRRLRDSTARGFIAKAELTGESLRLVLRTGEEGS